MVNAKTLVQCFQRILQGILANTYQQMPNCLLTPLLTHLFCSFVNYYYCSQNCKKIIVVEIRYVYWTLLPFFHSVRGGLISITLIFLQFVTLADALISPIFLKGCSRFLCIYFRPSYILKDKNSPS